MIKFIATITILALIGAVLYQRITFEPPQINVPIIKTEKPKSEPEPIKPKPEPKKKIILPSKGITNPNCNYYAVVNGKARVIGKLRNVYFDCIVLKEIKSSRNTYYLIKLTEAGYYPDIYILAQKDTFILPP